MRVHDVAAAVDFIAVRRALLGLDGLAAGALPEGCAGEPAG